MNFSRHVKKSVKIQLYCTCKWEICQPNNPYALGMHLKDYKKIFLNDLLFSYNHLQIINLDGNIRIWMNDGYLEIINLIHLKSVRITLYF